MFRPFQAAFAETLQPVHDSQQGGLARSIWTNDNQWPAVFNGQTYWPENRFTATAHANVAQDQGK